MSQRKKKKLSKPMTSTRSWIGKARPIEKDKSIITDELKSQDKKKIKHNVDKSRLIGERQSNLKKTRGDTITHTQKKLHELRMPETLSQNGLTLHNLTRMQLAARGNDWSDWTWRRTTEPEKKLAMARDICTSFYARRTLGPEPLVEQKSKELKTISHPWCQNRLERTSSKQ